jgi:glycosyltransferase involved in cell wall biosynthesis
MADPTLSILMPVYNEEATVERALRQLLGTNLGIDFHVVVVDDGSTDRSREIVGAVAAEEPERVVLLSHDRNRGKGAAIRTGLGSARGQFTTIFDADLEYAPEDIKTLLEPLSDGTANAVFGVRAFNGYSSHSFLYVLGNRFVTFAANALFNVYLRDVMTCHKAIRTDAFRALPLRADGFDVEPEIAVRLLQNGERIFEVPVHYKARASDEGKKLTATDGFRVLRTLVRCRVTPPNGRP